MSTRNPMNQRYQGEGPGGQTRKSASSAKPTSKAASSVRIKKKPQTEREKRAARKANEREAAQKAKVRAEKRAQKEAALAAQTVAEPAEGAEVQKPQKEGYFSRLKNAQQEGVRAMPEYRKWRRVYWILISIGLTAVVISFILIYTNRISSSSTLVLLIIAYAAIIPAFLVEYFKVRPLVKKQRAVLAGKKTPKALKHEQEAARQAAEVEAARKAAQEAKKNRRKKGEASSDKEE